jgi:hypothetical protein
MHTRRSAAVLLGVMALALAAPAAHADVLYAATGSGGVNGELVTLNPETGAVATDVGPLVDAAGNRYGLSGLAFQPGTAILYGATATKSPTAGGYLVTINPSKGLVSVVGAFFHPK